MRKYKVVRLMSAYGAPSEAEIEKEIASLTGQGWHFLQITTAGTGGSGGWVYIVFER
jgi:hypothetical protein